MASWRSLSFVRARALGSRAVWLILLAACTRTPEKAPAPAASDANAAAIADAPTDAGLDAAAAARRDAEADTTAAYQTGEPVGGKSVGHSSLVFKLKLDNGLEAAFKPRSRKALGATRYKGEIAAYRLARVLGLSNVPVALARTFTATKVRKALAGAKDGRAWDEEAAPLADGSVPGALIPWLDKDHFAFFEIHNEPSLSRWRDWLMTRASVIPETALLDGVKITPRFIAGQLSTMIVFDYLTANWDRFSGGNVGIDKATETVLFVDNDGAFYETPNLAKLSEQLADIQAVHRFSKSFVAQLRALDAKKLEAAVGDEAPGAPLLPAKVVAGVEERRAKVIGVIDAKIAADGAPAVLAFD